MITTERVFVQSGVFQVLEQGVVSQCPMYQLPMVAGALVSSFDLSQSNQMLAFGDTCGEYVCSVHICRLHSNNCVCLNCNESTCLPDTHQLLRDLDVSLFI